MHLNPNRLHVKLSERVSSTDPVIPRFYTLTHSDSTGELFLTIGESYDQDQISGWYTRFMRDEVLAEWQVIHGKTVLLVHCHLSGGLILGTASWRYQIFERELPLVFEALRYGDRHLFVAHPELDQAIVTVKFHTRRLADQREEQWGHMREYSLG